MKPRWVGLLVGLCGCLVANGSTVDLIRIPLHSGAPAWDDAMSRAVGIRPLDPNGPETFHIWVTSPFPPVTGFEIAAARARRCHGREEYRPNTGILMAKGYCDQWIPLPDGNTLETLRGFRRFDGQHMACWGLGADGSSYTVAGSTGGSRFAWTWTDTGGCNDHLSARLLALMRELHAKASGPDGGPTADHHSK